MDIYTIVLLAAIILIGLKLFSELGKRNGGGKGPMEGYGPRNDEKSPYYRERGELDNVISLPATHHNQKVRKQQDMEHKAEIARHIVKIADGDKEIEAGLKAIADADPQFDPKRFIDGAKTAYEVIVIAFAEGNRKLLRQLLSRDVYKGFAQALDEREHKKLRVDTSFVGINKAVILKAGLLKGKNARITMKFVSTLITAIYDHEGNIVEGDPQKVRDITDIWTFSRDTGSRDPNWKLEATEGAA